jgi:phage terminase large subunit GpA-like protein
MSSAKITKLFSDAIRSAIPDGSLKISQWADKYRIVPPERSTRPGPWSTNLVPYLREPMDVVTNPDVEEIVLQASSRVAKTEFLVNVAGYFIHIDPSPILFVAEIEEKAKAWSKECFAPTVRVTPELRELVSDPRMRDSDNTTLHKLFPGGHIGIVAATSPASLSSRPIRILLLDEVDGYKPTAEGDPVTLAQKRTTTFSNRKLVLVSSPRDRDASTIERRYLASDRRKYFLPCPHCGEFQVLNWHDKPDRCCCPKLDPEAPCSLRHGCVKWDDGDPTTAYYVCVNGCMIEHDEKPEMLAAGHWRAEAPLHKRAGFWINDLYSPFVTWAEMVTAFLEKKKDPEALRVWINTSIAETWEPITGEILITDLTERQEDYQPRIVPRLC